MTSATDSLPVLGPRFSEALVYAHDAHATQKRKGTDAPYVGHLLAVTALVLEDGGSEDEAIAALLHDAVEDQGGEARLADIERLFGPKVASIVAECSDTTAVGEKEDWLIRKKRYVHHMAEEASAEAVRVSLADKLHNAQAIRRDYDSHGDAVWDRFSVDKEMTVRYYRSLVEAYRKRLDALGIDSPQFKEFERAVDALGGAAGIPDIALLPLL